MKTNDFVDKVLKALDICANTTNSCHQCPYYVGCMTELMHDSAKLIRMQHKKLSAVSKYRKSEKDHTAIMSPGEKNVIAALFKGR